MQLFFPVTLLTKTGKLASIAKYIDGLKASKLATEISKISKKYKKIADKLEKRLSTSNIQAFLDLLKFMSEKMRLGTKGFVNWLEEIFEGFRKWLDDLFGPNSKELAIYNKKLQKMWDDFDYTHLVKGDSKKKPCFLAGTLVLTQNGLVEIEKIQIGDQVWSCNQKTNANELKTVLETFANYSETHLKIITDGNDILELTGQHLMWLPLKNKWEKAINLETGDVFLNFDKKHCSIQTLSIINTTSKTYNLEIEQNHNYFVGNNKLLSHNASKVSRFASTEVLEVYFYELIDYKKDTAYVGQTIQGVLKRGLQHDYDHKKNPKKKPWMNKVTGTNEIWINGAKGPFKMTPFEAAVTEMYEINTRGGLKKLGNKQNPISKKKFEHFKKTGNFNPCKFYA